ncbi:MAG: hypothetical protein K2Q06_15910 [Parvularculaceae bacterium]|nr:hypothetical protein [Parvularculaceae bacterium]
MGSGGHWRARVLALALFALAGAGAAAEPFLTSAPEATATLGVDSVSVFRGYRATRLNPNPHLFVDLAYPLAYAGAYVAPTAFGDETDVLVAPYAGVTPRLLGFDLDIGVGAYTFPGSRPFVYEIEGEAPLVGHKWLIEPYAGVKRAFGPIELTGFAYFTPDTLGEAGPAWYGQAEFDLALPFGVSAGASYGVSRFHDRRLNADYDDVAVWLDRSVAGFDLRLALTDTIGAPGPSNRVVWLRVERAFTLYRPRADRMADKILRRFVIDKCRLGVPR